LVSKEVVVTILAILHKGDNFKNAIIGKKGYVP